MSKQEFEKIVNHIKGSGFVFQGSEIYGGLANTWDYGPLGIELKDNIKKAWWNKFVQSHPNNVGIQSAILMNPQVWQASGHLSTFTDPLMDCKSCKTRHRADKLIEEFTKGEVHASVLNNQQMKEVIIDKKIPCPNCGSHDFTDIRQFNLMFKTFQGVLEDASSTIYLRPETAQGMFVNFKNVQRSMRKKIPFGIGQIGKSFRNEITPGNFIFRTREFEQMELEFFCKPGDDLTWYAYWQKFCMDWLIALGLKAENLRIREHDAEELSHYSVATSDIEYLYPWGWDELWGIADRTDYDLTQHMTHSKQNMEYFDPNTNEKYIPFCVEPAVGVERLLLAFVCDSYKEEVLNENDTRLVLALSPMLAPVKIAILPLSNKLSAQASEVYTLLANKFVCDFDESGSIGKRYRRQDAIGTPFCVTVDFETQNDQSVTIRFRDSMEQKRVLITDIEKEIAPYLEF
ncbi:MAG: glycine--tRNA ligase [Erysipelotrichaceae bacterium]|nr:glycine--tRNA ligase [Erysipelotrichaceae bacterium]MDP3306300.1 glycine--tRNA ligase [Erysipelotrichaceae bacterium]